MAFGGDNAESYHDEGLTAMMKGDLRRAVKFFHRALELDSSFLAARHQLGKCYIRLGQAAHGVELLQQVVTHKPTLVPARLDLGHGLLATNQIEAARTQFLEVQTLQPDNPRAYLGLAQVAFEKGDWEAAVTLTQQARMRSGPNFGVLFLMGRAAKVAGNLILAEEVLREAEALIEKSVELTPDTPEGHYLRGELCFVRDRFHVALDHYRAAEDRADPQKNYVAFGETFTVVDIWVKRGLCMQRLGNLEAARELGGKVLAQSPDHKIAQALTKL